MKIKSIALLFMDDALHKMRPVDDTEKFALQIYISLGVDNPEEAVRIFINDLLGEYFSVIENKSANTRFEFLLNQ